MAEDGALAAYFQVDLGPNPAQQLVERVQVAFKLHDSLSTFSSVQPLPKVIHECAQAIGSDTALLVKTIKTAVRLCDASNDATWQPSHRVLDVFIKLVPRHKPLDVSFLAAKKFISHCPPYTLIGLKQAFELDIDPVWLTEHCLGLLQASHSSSSYAIVIDVICKYQLQVDMSLATLKPMFDVLILSDTFKAAVHLSWHSDEQEHAVRQLHLASRLDILVGTRPRDLPHVFDLHGLPRWLKIPKKGGEQWSKAAAKTIKQLSFVSFEHVPKIAESRNMAAFNYLMRAYFDDRRAGSAGTGRRELLWSLAATSSTMVDKLHQKQVADPYLETVMSLPQWRQEQAQYTSQTSYLIPQSIDIVMVGDAEGMRTVLSRCQASTHAITFDCEWCPTQDVRHTQDLFQLAADGAVFVVDALSDRQAFAKFLHELTSGHELFGFGTQGDSSAIADILSQSKLGVPNITIVDVLPLLQQTVEKIPFPASYASIYKNERVSGSLRSVVQALCQIEIDKSEQMCDWNRRPLRPECIHYAALDAYALVKVLEVVNRAAEVEAWPEQHPG